MALDIEMTKKQKLFIDSTADETLFGGAARWWQILWATTRCFIICFEISKEQTTDFKKDISRA